MSTPIRHTWLKELSYSFLSIKQFFGNYGIKPSMISRDTFIIEGYKGYKRVYNDLTEPIVTPNLSVALAPPGEHHFLALVKVVFKN